MSADASSACAVHRATCVEVWRCVWVWCWRCVGMNSVGVVLEDVCVASVQGYVQHYMVLCVSHDTIV